MARLLLLFVCLIWLSGCGTVVRYLDATWVDDHKSYEEGKPLPALEVVPELKQE
ncbi:hypothetical protein QUF74_07725 [Candidatus Halobeggiatoa sp. HSG11]|nr:hypothetical protein [Candidatus Halobeggiatoa sp. HSG11]